MFIIRYPEKWNVSIITILVKFTYRPISCTSELLPKVNCLTESEMWSISVYPLSSTIAFTMANHVLWWKVKCRKKLRQFTFSLTIYFWQKFTCIHDPGLTYVFEFFDLFENIFLLRIQLHNCRLDLFYSFTQWIKMFKKCALLLGIFFTFF